MRSAIATSLIVEAQSVVASEPSSRTFGDYNNYQVPCRVYSIVHATQTGEGGEGEGGGKMALPPESRIRSR